MSKKKVMDDLDALLADLQSTTTHIQNYQERQDREREVQSRESTPPPLPPHPNTHALNNYYDNGQDREQEAQSRESSPPPPHPHSNTHALNNYYDNGQPLYEQTNVKAQYSSNTARSPTHHPGNGVDSRQTPLGNNLSELDTLLQDLSSAQFIAEVDRRHSAQSPGGPNSQGEYMRGASRERDQLDSSLPPPPPRQEEMMQNHYESVNLQHSPSPAHSNHSMGHSNQSMAHSNQNYHGNRGVAQTGSKPASTATRELDDLMASLSEFKMSAPRPMPPYPSPNRQTPQHVGEPPYAQPSKVSRDEMAQAQHGSLQSAGGGQSNSLDAMLGNLNTDMTKQGVMTVPRGDCAACNNPIVGQVRGDCATCNNPIVGQVITALGRIWHPEHFVCNHCEEELGTRNFFERDGLPYCEKDYHLLFSPRCAACSGPILHKCMTALDTTYHPECFRCAHCDLPFDEDGFHEKDGQAFCRKDYFAMFAPKCGGCNQPIMENYISALSKQWHPDCFVCRECGMPFGASSFFEHDGLPYCETHYHARRGSLCAGCTKPITGRCITAMYKKFHPEHFVCAFCLKQLNKGTFKEQNDKPYCHACFAKLFG